VPSWGSPSPGSSLLRPWFALPRPSPLVLRQSSYGTLSRLHLRVSPHRRPDSSLARQPTLLRFATSSSRSLVRELTRTGLIFSPRARRHVTAAPIGPLGSVLAPCRSRTRTRVGQPLLAAFAGLFHPAGTPRLSPSGLSSFQGAVPPLGGLCPPAVAPDSPLPCESEEALTRPQGLAPPGSPLLYGQRLTSRRLGALLGFTLSRVLPPSAVVRASATLPSRALAELVRDALSPAPQGISAPKARLVSRETADPLEVCDLVESLTRSGTQPDRAYLFASGPTPRHRST
jgi:hypothetical protein